MTTATVWGQGAWMVGRPSVAAVLGGGEERSAEVEPDISAYPSRLMRATSQLTRMSANVAAQAIASSGVDPSTIQSVFGSAFGEISIALEQLEMMVSGDGKISPLGFGNSVHNTAAGVFSVATANRSMSTSIAAGELTVGYAILEAQALLDEGVPHVLVVVGDEPLPEPLHALGPWPAFAAAFVLGRDAPPAGGRSIGPIHDCAEPVSGTPEALASHPCRGAYALLSALQRPDASAVVLSSERGRGLALSVHAQE
jgi:hypothetical protein